jgi:hypothetical protein
MEGLIGFVIFIIFWVGFTRVETKVARIDEAIKRIEKQLESKNSKEKK